jgi:hypothetical protein
MIIRKAGNLYGTLTGLTREAFGAGRAKLLILGLMPNLPGR